MASNQDFIFKLGADISQFTKSITEVERELKDVRNTLKNQTGQALVETNRYIQQLEGSINSLKKAGLDKLPQAAQGGTAALFSLSQVARDAPFGFIAIQNNLPLVVDQFGQLARASGGLGGALKQVGSSLIGPAGISFAFGAVIAGVTALIQKYGSLGAAFEAIIGGSKRLSKEQRDFAKSLADEATEVVSLATLYPKFEGDRKKQFEIIKKLNQVSPEYFGNLKAEKVSIDDITASLDKYIDSFIGKIYIESQQKRINELFTKYAEQITRLVDAELERKKGLKDTKTIVDNLGKSTDQLFKQSIQDAKKPIVGDISLNINPVFPLNTTQGAIDNLKAELKTQLAGVFGEIDVFKNFINIDGLKQLKTKIKEVEALWSGFAPAASFAGDEFNNAVKKSAKNLEGWRYIIEQVAMKSMQLKTNLDGVANSAKNISNTTFDRLFQSLQNQDMLVGLEEMQRKINKVFKGIDEQTKSTTKTLQNNFNNIANIIESSLIEPLTYLFDKVLEGGKISWKEFGNIVLEQLKRILIQVLATTAAVAIADALTGGGYSATARLADKATGGGGFTKSIGGSANFGGLNPGGLAMSGSVSLSLRGADLIGSINRTNTNINRIG
jgi:hypothetical protein